MKCDRLSMKLLYGVSESIGIDKFLAEKFNENYLLDFFLLFYFDPDSVLELLMNPRIQ